MLTRGIAVLATIVCLTQAGAAASEDRTVKEARALLDELVRIDSSNPPGHEELVARAVAAHLEAAGLKPEVVPFGPGRANVVTRLRGDGSKRPLLLLAHIDVVGAVGQPWTVPAFQTTEKGGWLYGRGVVDDKGWAAIATALVLELQRSHTKLHRDVILALTGDEESGGAGIRYILDKRPELLGNPELALNEGGGVLLDDKGKPRLISLSTAEKTFQDFELVAKGVGGHSSVPNDENAIYRLARALDKLSAYQFPTHLTPVIRDSLRGLALTQPEARARALRAAADAPGSSIPSEIAAILDAHPPLRAAARTTCVATLLGGGTRNNALPVEAHATINCRILPVDRVDDIQRKLAEVVGKEVEVKLVPDWGMGPEMPVTGPVRDAVEKVGHAVFGRDVLVTARVTTGATDSRFLRKAGVMAYGIGLLAKPDELTRNPHGPDEGFPLASLPLGVRFLRGLVQELAE